MAKATTKPKAGQTKEMLIRQEKLDQAGKAVQKIGRSVNRLIRKHKAKGQA